MLLHKRNFSCWKYLGAAPGPMAMVPLGPYPVASWPWGRRIWWVCLIAIRLRCWLCGAWPPEGLEPFPPIFWLWGSCSYESPIIRIFLCPRMCFIEPKKPLAARALPQTSLESLRHSPHPLENCEGESPSSDLTLSAPTRGVQKVLQLDHIEEWKCYKLHFIFQYNLYWVQCICDMFLADC